MGLCMQQLMYMSEERKLNINKRKESIAKLLILDNFNSRKQYHDNNKKEWYDSVEEYILALKSDFPEYTFFGHSLQVITHPHSLASEFNIPNNVLAKIVTEYIVNYGESSKNVEVDFVPKSELGQYLKNNTPMCNADFFESMWDKLTYISDRWGGNLKDSMWEEILPEVESAMENAEEDKDGLVHFDSLYQEEGYFRSYWHYPIDNLGWTKDMLCDWYYYNIPTFTLSNYFLSRYEDKFIHELPLWGSEPFYIIEVSKLF